MELSEIKDRLIRLDSNKLIDVVKNYRQYGYSDDIRNYALTILEERGITRDDLQLTGNLENTKYDYANEVFASFKKNSKTAFLFYGLGIIIRVIIPRFYTNSTFPGTIISIAFILAIAIYFFFLVRSFLDQNQFYKLTGEEYGTEGALMYLFLGMPFYIVMYFTFQSQMKERLKMIT